MQDAAVVRVAQRFRQLHAVPYDLFDGKRASRQPRAERLPLDELHRDVGLAAGLADFVDRADVRMVERGRGPRLSHESRPGARIIEAVRREDLDGDVPMEMFVVGAIDLAHAAGTELVDDAVVSEALTGTRQPVHDQRRV